MSGSSMRNTTNLNQDAFDNLRSSLCLVHEVSKRLVPDHAHQFSPRKFTQSQLMALVYIKQILGFSYRDLAGWLKQSSELRRAIGLRCAPNYSCLSAASKRLRPELARLRDVIAALAQKAKQMDAHLTD